MEKNKKNEELQSRRDFFKKAAKTLGILALASAPTILNAAEATPMGCSGQCHNSCYRGCAATCTGTCQTTCNRSCYHSHARRMSMVENIEQ